MNIPRLTLVAAVLSFSTLAVSCSTEPNAEAAAVIQNDHGPMDLPALSTADREAIVEGAKGANDPMRCYDPELFANPNYVGLTLDEAGEEAAKAGEFLVVIAAEGAPCGPITAEWNPAKVLVTVMDGRIHTAG